MGSFDLTEFGYKLAVIFLPFLFSLCFHEYAHGLVAKWKGDLTAEMSGRLTLNPVAHIHPIGTILMPMAAIAMGGLFFGFAKPVPVNTRNLRKPKEDMFWIAFAGPLSNVLLAFIGAFAMAIMFVMTGGGSSSINMIFEMFILINLFLALFNLLPIHPLDGGKVLARFLPYEANRFLDEHQNVIFIIVLVLLLTGMMNYLAQPVYYAAGLLRMMAVYLAIPFMA